MDWSTWGVAPPGADASDRTVLSGGGEVLVLSVDARRARELGRLGDRWQVITHQVPVAALPYVGDVVVWRGRGRGGRAWGTGPTRVLAVDDVDDAAAAKDGGPAGVTVLVDRRVAARGRADTASLAEYLAGKVPVDGAVPTADEWAVLGLWGLHPACPRCGASSRVQVYGMVAAPPLRDDGDVGADVDDEADDVEYAGCVIGPDAPAYRCRRCGHGFSLRPRYGSRFDDDDDLDED